MLQHRICFSHDLSGLPELIVTTRKLHTIRRQLLLETEIMVGVRDKEAV